jgi:hypothetical protein
MSTAWIAAFATLWAIVIVLGVLVFGMLQRLEGLFEDFGTVLSAATQRLRLDGLQPGALVGPFTAVDVTGRRFTDADLRQWPGAVVLFLSSSCAACEQFVRDLAAERAPELGIPLVVVADELGEAKRLAAAQDVTVLLQKDSLVARAFESHRTPHAFVVDDTGRVVTSGSPNSWDGLHDLVARLSGGGEHQRIPAAAVAQV